MADFASLSAESRKRALELLAADEEHTNERNRKEALRLAWDAMEKSTPIVREKFEREHATERNCLATIRELEKKSSEQYRIQIKPTDIEQRMPEHAELSEQRRALMTESIEIHAQITKLKERAKTLDREVRDYYNTPNGTILYNAEKIVLRAMRTEWLIQMLPDWFEHGVQPKFIASAIHGGTSNCGCYCHYEPLRTLDRGPNIMFGREYGRVVDQTSAHCRQHRCWYHTYIVTIDASTFCAMFCKDMQECNLDIPVHDRHDSGVQNE